MSPDPPFPTPEPGSSGVSRTDRSPEHRGNRLKILILAGLLLATCGAVIWLNRSGERSLSPAAISAYQQGQQEYRRGELQSALASLDKAREFGYPEQDLEPLVALVFEAGNESERAEPMLARSLAAGREPRSEIAEALARIYLRTYRLAEARAVLEKWSTLAPQDPRPLVWLAEADIREAKDPRIILSRYEEAVKRAPTDESARLGLAQQRQVLGDEQNAKQDFLAYFEHHPQSQKAEAYLGLGRAQQALGEDVAAAETLRKALAINPNLTEALTRSATILLRRNKVEEALLLADKAVAVDPFDPENRYTRATILARLGRSDDARREQEATKKAREELDKYNALKLQLAKQPENAALKAEAARWLLDHGRAEEGVQWARMAVAQQPNQPLANRVLADYHQAKGEIGLANSYRLRAGK